MHNREDRIRKLSPGVEEEDEVAGKLEWAETNATMPIAWVNRRTRPCRGFPKQILGDPLR
jgi:hypothetical protein